jgi:hypothetical protein
MRAALALGFLAVFALAGRTASAQGPGWVSGRLGIGYGARIPPGAAQGRVFELAPRAEMLFASDVGGGPALELRTSNFNTAELTAGLTGVVSDGFRGVMAGLGAGHAWRAGDQDGAVLTANIGAGIVRMRGPRTASTTLYLSFRHAATGPSRDELTVGLSLGGGLMSVIGSLSRF